MFNGSKILILALMVFIFFAGVSFAGDAEPSPVLAYSDARAFNNNGVDFVAQGKYQEAAKEFEKAVALDPKFHAARYNLALAHYNLGSTKEAIHEFQELVNSSYYFVNAHYNLGTIYLREGMVDKAIEQLKIVVELEPNHPEAHFNLGYIYFKKDLPDDALIEYKKGIEIKPDSLKGRLSLAFIYEKKGMYKEATDEYLAALNLDPQNQDATQAVGSVEAISKIADSLKANPKDAVGYLYLGHIYYARGMYQEAADNYNKALQIDPKNKKARACADKSVVEIFNSQDKKNEKPAQDSYNNR